MILSIIHISVLEEYKNKEDSEIYTKTQTFAKNYYLAIRDRIQKCYEYENQVEDRNLYFTQIEEGKENIFYSNNNYVNVYLSGHNEIKQYIDYIIIQKETNNIFTNIKSENYEEEIKKIYIGV